MQKNYPNLDLLASTPILYSTTFDKGTVKRLISWWGQHYGFIKTARMLDILKHVGFYQATLAGVSISVHDLHIPHEKKNVLQKAQNDINLTSQKWQAGLITSSERVQKALYTWTYANDLLKPGILHYFLSTNPFNPVYMMAFSGARGNISQVRQLIGMRGLMSNSKGTLIEFPITSNFREGLSISEYVMSCYGARKGLVDTAIRTADAGYMTRRLVDVAHALVIRTADCETKKGIFLEPLKLENKIAVSLEKRSIGRVLAEDLYLNSAKKPILTRNSVITPRETDRLKDSVLVRSPITCECQNSLCQLCYGWSLCSNTIISIGEAVGIIAAQSIGEPGTQLTMRTFHTGGVFSGKSQSLIRSPRTGILQIHPKPDTLAYERTAFGEDGYEALPHTRIQIINESVVESTSFSIPEGSIIIVRNNEAVTYGQVIAMPPQNTNVLEDQEMTSEPIFAPISGEIGVTCFSNLKLCIPLGTFSRNVQKAVLSETAILESDRYYFFNQNVNLHTEQTSFHEKRNQLRTTLSHQLQKLDISETFIDEIWNANTTKLLNGSPSGIKNELLRLSRNNSEKQTQIHKLSPELVKDILLLETFESSLHNENLRSTLIQKALTWHDLFYQTKKLSRSYSNWKSNLIKTLDEQASENIKFVNNQDQLFKSLRKTLQNNAYTARNSTEFPHYIINLEKDDFSFLKYPSFQFIIAQADFQKTSLLGAQIGDKIYSNAIIQFKLNNPKSLIDHETTNKVKNTLFNNRVNNLKFKRLHWSYRGLLQYPLYKFFTKYTNNFIIINRCFSLPTKSFFSKKKFNKRTKKPSFMLHDLHVIKKCDSKSRYGSIGQYKSTENYIIGTVSKTSKNGLYSSFSTPILLQKKSQKRKILFSEKLRSGAFIYKNKNKKTNKSSFVNEVNLFPQKALWNFTKTDKITKLEQSIKGSLVGSLFSLHNFYNLNSESTWFSNFFQTNVTVFTKTNYSLRKNSKVISTIKSQVMTLWNLRMVNQRDLLANRNLSFINRWVYFTKYSPIPNAIFPSQSFIQKLNLGNTNTNWSLCLKNNHFLFCQFTNQQSINEFYRRLFVIIQNSIPTNLVTFYNSQKLPNITNTSTNVLTHTSNVLTSKRTSLNSTQLTFSYAQKSGLILKTNITKNKKFVDKTTNYLLYLTSKNIHTFYTKNSTYYPLNASYRQGDSLNLNGYNKLQKINELTLPSSILSNFQEKPSSLHVSKKIPYSGVLFAVHTVGLSIRKATFTQIPLIKQYCPKVLFNIEQIRIAKTIKNQQKKKIISNDFRKLNEQLKTQKLVDLISTLGLTKLTQDEMVLIFEKLIGTLNYSKVTDSTIAVKEKTYFDESLVCWHSNTIENLVQKWIRQTQPHTLKPTRFIFAGDFLADLVYYKPTTSDIVQGLPKVESLFEGRKLVRIELALMFDFVKKIFMRYQNFGMIKFFVSEDKKVQFKSKRKVLTMEQKVFHEQNSYTQYLNLLLKCTRKRRRKKQSKTTIFNHFIKNRSRIRKNWNLTNPQTNIRLLTSFNKPYVFRYPLRSIEKKLSHTRRFELKKHGNFSSNLVFDFHSNSLRKKSLYKNIQIEGIRYSLVFLQTIQLFILENVQAVYFSQGVTISDKHIEVIIRQITSKVRVTLPGTSPISSGEIVSYKKLDNQNKKTIYQSQFIPYVLGMTQMSLSAEGFISAASFQETKRVLIQSVIHGRVDFLNGLKENVILGHRLTIGNNCQMDSTQNVDITTPMEQTIQLSQTTLYTRIKVLLLSTI